MPGQERFPRNEHLTRKRDFVQAYDEGEKWVGESFLCFVVRRTGQGRKMGCAVSYKVGNAVVRNRVKRYIREVYRKHRAELLDDIHLVIVARPAGARLSYPQCEESLRQLFQKGGVLRG